MRGIVSSAAYLPYGRLDRSQITAFIGQGGGKGTRAVASYDEDSTTMAVEAGRLVLHNHDTAPTTVLFGTPFPAYADKTNATAIHAALRLPIDSLVLDLGASTRSAVGGFALALESNGPTLVLSADVRGGLPGSVEEAMGGDAGAALLVADDVDGPLIAEFIGRASVTDEFVERWRAPGEIRTKVWDDKFSEVSLVPLGERAWKRALAQTGLVSSDVAAVAISAPSQRVGRSLAAKLDGVRVIDDFAGAIGNSGAAQPALLTAALLEQATSGQVLALVTVADGADVLLFRATEALRTYRPVRPIADQARGGRSIPYGKFLSWRNILPVEPPRRPEPQRVSATAAARNEDWKFAFVGSKERDSGVVHLPPARVSRGGARTDEMDPIALADTHGTIVTFTVDRMAYSPSPPVVFAVVDFDGGGRLPLELTDVNADEVEIGLRVEMTFRRLYSADGIANYFWKGRLMRDG